MREYSILKDTPFKWNFIRWQLIRDLFVGTLLCIMSENLFFISTSDLELIFHKYLIYVSLKESPLTVINSSKQQIINQVMEEWRKKTHLNITQNVILFINNSEKWNNRECKEYTEVMEVIKTQNMIRELAL